MQLSNNYKAIVDKLEFIFDQSALDSESQLNISPKIATETTWNKLNLWQIAMKAIALSNWWQLCLIVLGSVSSIIYPHPPLISFAAIAGSTLTRQKALTSVISIWFANQFYGFVIRHYPRTIESLTWGVVMGISILFVTWLITLQPKFSRYNFQGYLICLVVSVLGGYVIYQGSIVLIAQLMDGHKLSATILWGIFWKDVVWTIVLSTVHSCAVAAIAIKLIKQIIKR